MKSRTFTLISLWSFSNLKITFKLISSWSFSDLKRIIILILDMDANIKITGVKVDFTNLIWYSLLQRSEKGIVSSQWPNQKPNTKDLYKT